MVRKTKQQDRSDSPPTPTATTPEPASEPNPPATPISSTPTPSTRAPSAPTVSISENPSPIEWIRTLSKFKPFEVQTTEEDEVLTVAEFKAQGTVISSFLKGTPNKFSHTLVLNMDPEEIQKIRQLVKTCPAYAADEEFRWPFVGTEAKFNSRANLNGDFSDTWDGRNSTNMSDINERIPLPADKIDAGKNVLVEYTIVPYLGRKATDKDEGFSAGCSLELLSVGLLSDEDGRKHKGKRFDFDSPSKKRRTK